MNHEIRLKWEPLNKAPMNEIEMNLVEHFSGKGSGVSILGNGTLLFITEREDNGLDAQKAMDEARFFIDFKVAPIGTNAYLVQLHSAVAVYVGKEEFEHRKEEIKSKLSELKFSSEEHIIPHGWTEDEYLIGVYGRGKLQRDAYDFNYFKRLNFSEN